MNPSPDRGKECLPPKKRDPRQGSVEHHVTLDEFKPPVPLRIRSSAGRGEGGREAGDRDRALTNPNPHLLHTPPTLPAPAPALQIPLPWNLSYSSPVSLYPGHVGERRVPGSPAWKDDLLSSPLPHHRWPLSLSPSPSSSASSFKAPYPADAREMWSYINSSRRDYSSTLLPSYLFSHSSLYPQDTSLFDARHRSPGKRPNGLDGAGSRTASTSRSLLTGEYMNDSNRARLDASPHSSHTNGGRRQQEEVTPRGHAGASFLEESPELHSSLQDRHPHGMVKSSPGVLPSSPHPLGPDPRAARVLDPLAATPMEAQIYYSLGSVCHPSPLTQSYPLYSPSGTPLYNLHRDPGPRQHNLRNSPHSPLGLPNSHDRLQREREPEREREKSVPRERERERARDNKHLPHDKDQDRDSEPERWRDRDRDRDRGRDSSPSHPHLSSPVPHPSPPALLPHFTKGSLIELASGRLKRVEELRTEDFLRSADTSPEFHLSTCTVLQISSSSAQGFSHLQVQLTDRSTQELLKVLVEYPFFVKDRGWSSCCPQKTTQLYGLPCRRLMEGDVCLALTPTLGQSHQTQGRGGSRAHRTALPPRAAGESGSSRREEMPPPPPPPPLPLPHLPRPAAPAAPCALVAEPPAQEQPRTRKRRWSAPDALSSGRTDDGLLDLPHGSKQMKWQ